MLIDETTDARNLRPVERPILEESGQASTQRAWHNACVLFLVILARGNRVQLLAVLHHIVQLEEVVGHSQIFGDLFPAFVVV